MKKILIHLLKPLSFLPAILMMYLIYSFSAQTGEVSGALSYEVSYQIVETKNEVLNENKTYDELAYSASSIEFYVRKAAHMTEYCLLAIAISFPLYVYGVRGIWLILLAGAGKTFQSAMEAERNIGGIDAGIAPAAQLQAQGRIHTGMQEAFIKTAGVPENRGLYCHAG